MSTEHPTPPEFPVPPSPRLVQALLAGAALGLLLLVALIILALTHVTDLSTTVAANQRADTNALCALRADLQTRVSTTQDFLLKHPNGIPGIPAPVLRSGIVNEQRTILALSPISCPVSEPPAR
jgi:hypothetical protein